ncbi:AMP-binding protein [Streptomyces sp. NPDC051162]|uniref:AMP-binding protein n=1 Tax=unclassified Streptomyces TaxID=2593676 RepID=UPI003417B115
MTEQATGHEADTLLGAVERLPSGRTPLPGMDANALLERVRTAAAALKAEAVEGEAVALRAPNSPQWVVAFLALLASGARPLLLEPDTPDAETARLLRAAGGGRSLIVPGTDDGLPPALTGPPGEHSRARPAVLLPTSGSTGASKLVARSEESLLAEGRRYRDGVGLTGEDTLLLPVPLSHAYALGWLFGGLLTGAALRPVPPAALGRIAAELSSGATVVALVPSVARLLATRRLRGAAAGRPPGVPAAPALRLAMVGAGPVDEQLDRAFTEAFGTGLARNYGSTETGAVLAGPAGLEPLCAGAPLPGVECELTGRDGAVAPPGTPGLLSVRVDGQPYAMGDLAVAVPGGLRILGREDRAIRRGGRWVSPLEIEEVLRGHPDVVNVRVGARRGRHQGEDGIVAEVSAAPGLALEALREHARRELAPHKVPDEFVLRESLPVNAAGKVRAASVYRLTRSAAEAARAYKTSEVLFALHDLGALEPLARGADTALLAGELGCDADALEWLLRTATALGVLTTEAEAPGARVRAGEVAAFVALEEHLSRGPVSREELAAVARNGTARRPFDERPPESLDPLVALYQGAMDGPGARARAALGLRLLRPGPGARTVEVTAGPGRYLERLLASDPGATGHLVTVGRLSGPLSPAITAAVEEGRVTVGPRLPVGDADFCVVANAVHGPGPGSALGALLGSLRPGGRLLVDDVFLPASGPGSELALDWLTHGGTAWPTTGDLVAGLLQEGAEVARHVPLDASPCHLIIAKEAGS